MLCSLIKYLKEQACKNKIAIWYYSFMEPCGEWMMGIFGAGPQISSREGGVKAIAVTHPVFSRFDLFDPRRDVLWRSGPGSVSGIRTCCSSDRACACWPPVGWLGRPWQPFSVWWECWQELPSSPPPSLTPLGGGSLLSPVALYWFALFAPCLNENPEANKQKK